MEFDGFMRLGKYMEQSSGSLMVLSIYFLRSTPTLAFMSANSSTRRRHRLK